MRFRKIAVALFACMALAAVAAGSAQAQWTIGTAGNALGTTAHQKVEVNKVAGTTLTLSSTVLGAPIVLTAEDVHCAAGVECTIDGESFGTNHSTGTLEFTKVTVNPATCSVPGGKVVTNPLVDEVIMDPTNATGPVFDKFSPATGSTFTVIKLEGEECPFNEIEAPVTGTATGEAELATGELSTPQVLHFGKAQQETGGGALKLGKAEAVLTGVVANTLSSGQAFGADE